MAVSDEAKSAVSISDAAQVPQDQRLTDCSAFRTPQKKEASKDRKSPPMSPKPYVEPDACEEEAEAEQESEADQDGDSPSPGILYASQVILDGPRALRMLAWVLGEMQRSPVRPLPAHQRDFLYVVQKDALGGYERLPHTLDYYKRRMPKCSNTKLYILEELGHRFHGRVYRAMSKNGNLCVLKYFIKPQHVLQKNGKRVEVGAEAVAKKAVDYWNLAYNFWLPSASAGKWGGGDAMLMPDLEKVHVGGGRNLEMGKWLHRYVDGLQESSRI